MTDTAFAALSDSLEAAVKAGAPLVAGLEWADCGRLSGVLWQAGVIVTSEQSLPGAESYTAILPGGGRVAATLAGRDPATNVAALRIEGAAAAFSVAEPRGVGGLALALGSDFSGGATARLGAIELLGPAWQSQRGGQIDRLVRIGVRLGAAAEGGPVLDANGGVLGMSTFGPRRGVLVIPSATIARVLVHLLQQGRIVRGWLGAGLHPVALPAELAGRAGAASGLMVVGFAEGTPAAGGLLPGDILLEIGGARLTSPRAVAAALGPETVGQSVAIKLVRGGAVISVNVAVAARPA
jgi:S1-C subfamily serine protease